jgi:hypothetical protein
MAKRLKPLPPFALVFAWPQGLSCSQANGMPVAQYPLYQMPGPQAAQQHGKPLPAGEPIFQNPYQEPES